ncbi:MAG: DUF2155 domain-containing protein [Kordiimonadaceae bacterium]|nr:DUF2155 domain-containing protein [Kordiimonadaceae bacterium]
MSPKLYALGALLALTFPASVSALSGMQAQELILNDQIQVPDAAQAVPQNRVVLRALDKITARITEHELEIGQEMRFGSLALVARYCRTRPPIEPPETFAYLEIDDVQRDGRKERVFEGWMVASSPALNALEHSVYDIWVINCKMVEPETETPSN